MEEGFPPREKGAAWKAAFAVDRDADPLAEIPLPHRTNPTRFRPVPDFYDADFKNTPEVTSPFTPIFPHVCVV